MSVSAFPISRELSSVRIVADAFARLSEEEAASLWHVTATHLLAVATERGQNTLEARAEVDRFFDALKSCKRLASGRVR
ncbi:DUF6074 family protein [Mesorhizobium sp. M1423]|uniref:DUF6074 family protein n=1 Tax=Mesorhizobium sp. M1423 TaxID=2957101 RepID=UPI003336E985